MFDGTVNILDYVMEDYLVLLGVEINPWFYLDKKLWTKENLHDIVNGLATALLKNIMEVFNNVKETKQ